VENLLCFNGVYCIVVTSRPALHPRSGVHVLSRACLHTSARFSSRTVRMRHLHQTQSFWTLKAFPDLPLTYAAAIRPLKKCRWALASAVLDADRESALPETSPTLRVVAACEGLWNVGGIACLQASSRYALVLPVSPTTSLYGQGRSLRRDSTW
jgi:hypothetical protein